MKNIVEFLTEAVGNQITVAINHDDEDYTLVIYGNLNNNDKKLLDKCEFIYETIKYTPGNLVSIAHDDETIELIDLGCKNLAQLKTKVLGSIKKSLDDAQKSNEEYPEIHFDPFDLTEMDFGEDGLQKPEFYWNWICAVYNDSQVDGDSQKGRVVLDTTKNQFILGADAFDGREVFVEAPQLKNYIDSFGKEE